MIFEEHPDETPGTKRDLAQGGLPTLTGTEAEIAQADPIRTAILVEADDILTELRSNETLTEAQADTAVHAPEQVTPWQVKEAKVALNRLRNQAEASWWIAHRSDGARALLEEFIRSA